MRMNEVESQMSPEVAKLSPARRSVPRRTFLCRMGLGAIALAPGAALFSSASNAFGEEDAIESGIRVGDAALLRFAAALEILEADFWIQYNELGGIQDSEVPGGTGIEAYTEAINVLDEDMNVYIHDNTDDEITHHQFLNAYLVSKGAAPANLNPFRTTFRRRSQLWRLTSTQQFPGLMRTQRILISYRRSRILRLSTFQPLNKVATASTHR